MTHRVLPKKGFVKERQVAAHYRKKFVVAMTLEHIVDYIERLNMPLNKALENSAGMMQAVVDVRKPIQPPVLKKSINILASKKNLYEQAIFRMKSLPASQKNRPSYAEIVGAFEEQLQRVEQMLQDLEHTYHSRISKR